MKLLQIHSLDNVAVATEAVRPGETIAVASGEVTACELIPQGHKIALTDIRSGQQVIKYGLPIGVTVSDIKAGCHVHTHNMKTSLTEGGSYVYRKKEVHLPSLPPQKFLGYKRENGKVGIRNEIWIIPTVGCVNNVAETLAQMNQSLVKGSVEGIFAFTHPYGCSQIGDDLRQTKRLLAALCRHPNAGGVLVLCLGCENLTLSSFCDELGSVDTRRVKFLTCQDCDDEIAEGSRLLGELATYVSSFNREECSASDLIVGLKCGGSDGLSGITANPAVGRFSDKLIAMGGSTILTEVPEMFGAEDILFCRAQNKGVFDKAVQMIEEFKHYFTAHGQTVYENPSPGNKAGGITTLEDKSCGCVQKGGSAAITDVLPYGDSVRKRGLNLLSAPGNDLVSSTALTAAGAHMILFTTGRGTPFGAPVPTVKIATNNALFAKKKNWLDFNAGTVIDGETPDEVGSRLFDMVLDIAGGAKTKSEQSGARSIAIFKDGVTL